MTDKPGDTDPLERYFKAGRAHPARPDAALMARVLADAEAEAAQAPAPGRPVPRARPALLVRLADAIGGWPAMAGLATAAVAGVWIGVSAPAGLSGVAQAVLGSSTGSYVVDFDPADRFQIAEGDL